MQQEKHIAELKRAVQDATSSDTQSDPAAVAQIAEHVAKAFLAAPDEVAILTLMDDNRLLSFLYPEELRAVGTIPLTSTSALAARTARDRKPEVMNNFALVRHASVFEGVPLGRHEGEVIQKIMSAPITSNGRILGVVQVSRKGSSATNAGPDFSAQDLKALVAMTGVLAEFLQRSPAAPRE
jgi:signal transduction protein with GAF and PtsI domain